MKLGSRLLRSAAIAAMSAGPAGASIVAPTDASRAADICTHATSRLGVDDLPFL